MSRSDRVRVSNSGEKSTIRPFIHIVGAGPGDADLLTVKAARLISEAEVVVYDKLVSEDILKLISPDAETVYVGKASGLHILPQDEINQLLVELSKKYSNIVRLKGGDPLIFGRGGEEALTLYENNIGFEFVPGITAASACTTYAGIPLTHRGLANSVRFVTGHPAANKPLKLEESALSDPMCTLVIYMGVSSKEEIVKQFVEVGRSAQTPVAVIENGTTSKQRRIVTTLENLVSASNAQNIQAPAILVVGDVVTLANKLSWFRQTYDAVNMA